LVGGRGLAGEVADVLVRGVRPVEYDVEGKEDAAEGVEEGEVQGVADWGYFG
jgi:hypothetical protein